MFIDTIRSVIKFVKNNWTTIFSGIGTAILIGTLGYFFNKHSEIDNNVRQSVNAGDNSNIVQSTNSVAIDNFNVKQERGVQLKDPKPTIIAQVDRDAILQVKKSPPTKIDNNVRQSVNAGDNSNIIQSANNVTIHNFNVKQESEVQLKDFEPTIIAQAGRDAILQVKKSPPTEIDNNVHQSVDTGDNSNIIQSANNITIDNFNVKQESGVQLKDFEPTIIVQAGRDAILQVKKSPPNIKLVRVTVEDDHSEGGLKQKINVVMKNNGDKSAFLLNGYVNVVGCENIVNPNHFGMQYHLSVADWTYDVDISSEKPSFVGQHSIAPNEVINFNIVIGRNKGGLEVTVYKCLLRFKFDENEDLECGPFFLLISGPTVWDGGYQAQGPTPEQWGRAQVDNIRRLDKIGYDYRPQIHKDSRKYVEMIDPNIFKEKEN